ncbi:hypothetical protein KIS4809_5470 [Bacillus sp. ZZV12-4809]|nr:hypothetical protein KIS4809_5470 [Bacillus sp. ZZV12-4809]
MYSFLFIENDYHYLCTINVSQKIIKEKRKIANFGNYLIFSYFSKAV